MNASCPFCNHTFSGESSRTCPRCGEAISVKGQPAAINPIMARDIGATIDLATVVKRRIKQAMVASLLIMLAIAAIAFWKLRNQKSDVPLPAIIPNAVTTSPLELRGLGLLPANCNIVFAIQPGPLFVYAEQTKQDPVELLTKNRVPASFLGTLAKAGITLQQIDHFAGGLYLPDKDEELQIAFVLVLRQPLADEAKFLDVLKAKPNPNGYDVSFDKFVVRMKRVSATEWVFGLTEKDLASGGSLSPAMRELIGERVAKESAIWVAAHGDRWTEKPLVKLLSKDSLAGFAKWKAFAAGYAFGDSPRMSLAVKSTDNATAEALRTRFKGLATGETSRSGGEGDWATFEKPVDPTDLFGQLKRIAE